MVTAIVNAVPLIGRSSREEHAGRYWRSRIEDRADLLSDIQGIPDPAAEYVNTSCLLEPLREARQPVQALRPPDFPCTGRLRPVGARRAKPHDCRHSVDGGRVGPAGAPSSSKAIGGVEGSATESGEDAGSPTLRIGSCPSPISRCGPFERDTSQLKFDDGDFGEE